MNSVTTCTEFSFDGIAVGERGFEVFGVLGHRAKMGRILGFGEVLSRSFIHARWGVYKRGATTPPERPRTTLDVAPQLVPLSHASGDLVSWGRFLH